MSPVRSDLRQRQQYKGSVCHARMRQQGRRPLLAYQASIGDEIEIKRAGSIPLAPNSAERSLYFVQEGEERLRGFPGSVTG